MKRRRPNLLDFLLAFAKALLISLALMYLVEYFGWHFVREAGGGV